MKKKIWFILILALLILIFSFVTLTNADKDGTKKIDKLNTLNSIQEIQATINEYAPEEIIVKFKNGVKDEKISKINSEHGASLLSTSTFTGFKRLKIPRGKTVSEMVEIYSKNPNVEYAEPNYIAYALMVPNDPYYKYQWHLYNSVYGGIQMEEAWDISTGKGVTVVAVVDTGIRKGTDLANTCFVLGYDFVNNDTDPTDDNGHGTHVAGTIAQSTNNNLGVAGVAFSSCLMPVKVLNSGGSGTYAQVANGIYYAADNGAKIISLSLGGSSDSQTLKDAVAYAYNKGVTIIAAAGNDNQSALSYPATYDDYVIAVGATQYDETKAPYSNYGPSLDLVAPGGNNNLDQNKDGYADGVLQQTFAISRGRITWGYYFFQGTSMAAPHVSGVASLLIAKGNADANKDGISSPDEVRNVLQNTAEEKGATGRDDIYGYGLVDAYATLGWTAAPVIACSSDTECNDGNSCTTDVCVNLYCSNTAVTDGTTCDDGKFCTVNDVCTTGVCGGVAKDCSDSVACTTDTCDEAIDACVKTPNNALCDDGLYCNGAETCNAILGCQAGTPVNCDDGNDCTTDTCDESAKACKYTNLLDNTACTNGVCCSGICQGIACPTAVKCWSASNVYLYRASDQARKFCKCAQGSYGYSTYSYTWGQKTVYQYVDSSNNENWAVSSKASNLPVYKVKCTDGNWYNTNKDYFR